MVKKKIVLDLLKILYAHSLLLLFALTNSKYDKYIIPLSSSAYYMKGFRKKRDLETANNICQGSIVIYIFIYF